MSHTPHELTDEFPDDVQKIHDLKIKDKHFAKLSEEHHAVTREIHRIETNISPASDEVLENLKKKRLSLLDQISVYLAK
jgi:uncharacterized protein YdcH (DUF465 family)